MERKREEKSLTCLVTTHLLNSTLPKVVLLPFVSPAAHRYLMECLVGGESNSFSWGESEWKSVE